MMSIAFAFPPGLAECVKLKLASRVRAIRKGYETCPGVSVVGRPGNMLPPGD